MASNSLVPTLRVRTPAPPLCSPEATRSVTAAQASSSTRQAITDAPDAHTANNISAPAAPYEPAAEADGDAVNDWLDATCDEDPAGPASRGTHCEAGKKEVADMSAADPAGQTTRTLLGQPAVAPSRGTLAEEERLALAELRRTLSTDINPTWADYMVPTLLAEGQTNLLLQGFTREQRQALLGWQRVMDLRKQE